MRKLYIGLAPFMLSILAGCTSISSTLLNRLENDQLVGNSNGDLQTHGSSRPFKGVPITLRVPTHVEVIIRERLRLSIGEQGLNRLKSSQPHLSVETRVIHTEKVFTVDVKRPAAGTSDYTLDFGDGSGELENRQYFKQIKNKIVDETIQDSTQALKTVMSVIPARGPEQGVRASSEIEADDCTIFSQTRTIAWQRFDLDACDLELQIAAFVEPYFSMPPTNFKTEVVVPQVQNSKRLPERKR